MVRILIMGLPRTGKSLLAIALGKLLDAVHFDADAVRGDAGDWDFSREGRVRQAQRMRELADAKGGVVICAFVCPLPECREAFAADWVIWMDTEKDCPYPDTTAMFVPPHSYDFRVTEKNAPIVAERIARAINEAVRALAFAT